MCSRCCGGRCCCCLSGCFLGAFGSLLIFTAILSGILSVGLLPLLKWLHEHQEAVKEVAQCLNETLVAPWRAFEERCVC